MLDMRLASFAVLPAFALVLASGCSTGAGSGDMVKITSGETLPADGGSNGSVDVSEVAVDETGSDAAADPGPQPPIGLTLTFASGQTAVYSLKNEITTITPNPDGTYKTTGSFLNATQSVTVDSVGRNSATVTIETTDVSAGVPGEQRPTEYLEKTAASIEGSRLRGKFDGQGRGTELYLLGDGVGLNPMGPQAGSQEVMVGFMGVLLPGKVVAPGDTWSGEYDITASVVDVFEGLGAFVESGTMPITYSLIDYDEERNLAAIRVHAEGTPVIKIPLGGAIVELAMKVVTDGRALVRLDDGWLEELKIESIITIEGYFASKSVVRSTTRRVKK